ncbi:TRAP transporter substrate-binding protein DctP [Marinobacter oulmenensis]|uniref:TRAP-type C4-dicarboxylate transport system substrate-binding protein n=1 Tax=Marinobacter oulmenensis TaxID=643747 RepID=A0A840UAM1_9GAMM|nr:TRAP transporter substrate-binding protein DctP [Marinobacter oulmenensis]MBB5322032.1 TRAP-type C4-dicarboxylate transport system substrate-binding protein [Marinobacter oulmenensis]
MPIPRHSLTSLLLALSVLLTGCGESPRENTGGSTQASGDGEHPVTWRFALEEIEGSVQHAYAQALKEKIETVSDGDIVVEVFPYGSLGTSTQLTELTRNGSVNLAFASPGHLADSVPETGLFNLHFMLPAEPEVTREWLYSPDLLAAFRPAYKSAGLQLMGFVQEGWMAWTANKPLTTPADFEGLKIRTMTSDIAASTLRAYGADPVQTPYSQVYSDLQLHRIDGQSNPVFAIEEMDFHEVQSHLTLPRASRFISSLVANPDWLGGLDEQQQQWLKSAIADVSGQAWDIAAELNQQRLEIMVERGDIQVVRLSDAQREAFRGASQPARDDYLEATGKRGQKLLDLIPGE